MNNSRRGRDEHSLKNEDLVATVEKIPDEKRSKTEILIKRYVIIALIVFIILIGINKFISIRGFDVFGFVSKNPSQIALAYYFEKSGTPDDSEEVRAMLRRYGCHQEIHIYKNGQVVMKATYANGQIYEID